MHIIRRFHKIITCHSSLTNGFLQLGFTFQCTIEQLSTRLIIDMTKHGRCGQSRLTFMFVINRKLTFIVILVNGSNLQSRKHIILIGTDKLIGRNRIVILIGQSQRMFRKLASQILFLIERIFHLSQILHTFILKTVCHIAFQEYLRMKICCSLCSSSQSQAIYIIAGHHCIDRTYIHLTRITRFHVTFNQCL